MIVQFSIVPIGTGSSLSSEVSRVLELVAQSGLPYKLTPMGTLIEGNWSDIMPLIEKCHAEVLGQAERVLTTITVDDRKGRSGMMDHKIRSVEKILGRELKK